MKNVKFIIPCFFLFTINLFILTSCEKESFVEDTSTIMSTEYPDVLTQELNEIRVENGILVLDSRESLQNALTELQKMDPDAVSKWEDAIGFQSMHSIFAEVVEQEWKNETSEPSLSYLKAMEKGIIVKTEYAYELNLFNPVYGFIVNENGLVKIGRDIYQMTSNTLKKWTYGNIDNLDFILKSKDSNQSVQVFNLEKDHPQSNLKSIIWSDKCTSELKKSRLEVKTKFSSSYKNSKLESVLFIDYVVIARCLTYTEKGWKIDPHALIELRGFSELEISFYSDRNSTTKIESEASYKKTRSGYINFSPDLAGKYTLSNRNIFAKPGNLVSAKWYALAISNEREVHKCVIAKS
jgi:hypothetical protein